MIRILKVFLKDKNLDDVVYIRRGRTERRYEMNNYDTLRVEYLLNNNVVSIDLVDHTIYADIHKTKKQTNA